MGLPPSSFTCAMHSPLIVRVKTRISFSPGAPSIVDGSKPWLPASIATLRGSPGLAGADDDAALVPLPPPSFFVQPTAAIAPTRTAARRNEDFRMRGV